MVLLDHFWDDTFGGPHPDEGLGRLRKKLGKPLVLKEEEGDSSKKCQRSLSLPGTPVTPVTPVTPSTPRAPDNVWRSVFNPGSNLASKTIGSAVFDKPLANSPTVYDWMYSDDTRSKHHR